MFNCSMFATLRRMTRERCFLSVEDAASQLGIKPVTVRAHVARGNLKAQKLAGALWIDLDEMQRFLRERRARGHKIASRHAPRQIALQPADWDIMRSQAVQLEAAAPEPPLPTPAGVSHEGGAPDHLVAAARCLAEAPEGATERKSF